LEEKEHYLAIELREAMRDDASVCAFIHDNILNGIWFWDLENPNHEWMSPSFWTTLGYKPDEFPHTPQSWMDKIHPEDLEVTRGLINNHIKDPERFPYEAVVRYFHKDGSVKWIRCLGRAIFNKQGRPSRMLGAHIDITELRKKQAFIETQNRFLEIITKTSATFIATDETALDERIEFSMIEIAELLDCQRVSIFEYDFLNGFVSCLHEWSADKVDQLKDDLQFLNISDFYDFSIVHQEGKPIFIENIDSEKVLKAAGFAVPSGMQTLYLIPMMHGSVCHGFIEFNWSQQRSKEQIPELRLLSIYASVVENAIQRARSERSLRQEQFIASRLISRMNESVMILDLKGRVKEVNDAFMSMTGYTRLEFNTAAVPFFFFSESDNHRLVSAIQSTIYNQSQKLELVLKSKSGEMVPVEVNVSSITNDKGATLRYFTTIEDISAKKRAEKEMREMREMRDLLVETSNIAKVGGWEIDIETGEHLITEVTAQILEIGLQEQNIGEIVKIIEDEKEESANRIFKRALKKREDLNHEYEIVTALGNRKWVHLKAKLEFFDGVPDRFIGIIYDITDKVAQLRAIEERNRRLAEIAWTQSHVVRAPLARLLAITDYLNQKNQTPVEIEHFTQEIVNAATELDNVVKDITVKAEEVIYSNNSIDNEATLYTNQKTSKLNVILVDDDPVVLMLQANNVKMAELDSTPSTFLNAVSAVDYLKNKQASTSTDTYLILLDINMPEMDGWSFLDELDQIELNVNYFVIMVTSSTNAADKRLALAYPKVISFVEKVLTKEKVASFKLLPPLNKCYFS
jgi:PAS domain S-box-containing protein